MYNRLPLRRSWCKQCDQLIEWIYTAGGKRMPVETESVSFVEDPEAKNLYIGLDGIVRHGRPATDDDQDTLTGWIPHFAACKKGRRNEARAT